MPVPLHCGLSHHRLSVRYDPVSEPVSLPYGGGWIVTGFEPRLRLPDDSCFLPRVRLDLVPMVSTPVLVPSWPSPIVTGFSSTAGHLHPTNLPRRRGQVHGYCLNSGPLLGAIFVARILLIIGDLNWFLATGFWTRVVEASKECKLL